MEEERFNRLSANQVQEPRGLGRIGWAVIALGIGCRWALFFAGRLRLDQDEAMMGIMAHHVAHFEHFPIFFYGQHYLGTIEIPLAALFTRLMPEALEFSAWPIRLTSSGYLALFGMVHFRLARRFFGRRTALWTLFFAMIGPAYWMEYSFRLRHVVVMMTLGELMALATLRILDDWRERRARGRRFFLLGLIVGVAWWHYNLVAVYVMALIPLAAAGRTLIKATVACSKGDDSETRLDLPALARLFVMAPCCVLLAGLALGWFANPRIGYAALIGLIALPLAAAAAWSAALWRRGRRLQFMPALVCLGFVVGSFPVYLYLITLDEEFWLLKMLPRFATLPGDIFAMLTLDIAPMLHLTFPDFDHPNVHDLRPRSFVVAGIYAIGFYALARPLFARADRGKKWGAAYFFTLLLAVLIVNAATTRRSTWPNPRFLVPIYAFASVLLGLMVDWFLTAWEKVGPWARGRLARAAAATALAGLFFWLWMPLWLDMEKVEMAWPSGHRKIIMEMLDEFRERDMERISFSYNSPFFDMAYDFQYASRMKMRFNEHRRNDRLGKILDSSAYEGPIYNLYPGETPLNEGWLRRFEEGRRGLANAFRMRGHLVVPTRIDPSLFNAAEADPPGSAPEPAGQNSEKRR